jgi:hypothetical protein
VSIVRSKAALYPSRAIHPRLIVIAISHQLSRFVASSRFLRLRDPQHASSTEVLKSAIDRAESVTERKLESSTPFGHFGDSVAGSLRDQVSRNHGNLSGYLVESSM